MLVLAGPNQQAIPGDILLRAVLRSDLAPVPQSLEVVVRDDPDFRSYWAEGQKLLAGRDQSSFTVVKRGIDENSGLIQGPRRLGSINVIALMTSCAPIAQRMQRAVVREQASLGEIYRACGASAAINSDFTVPRFTCLVGEVPSYPVAIALQEEAGVLSCRANKIYFRRLADMAAQKAVATLPEAANAGAHSQFLERHEIPFAYSTNDAGQIVLGRRESPRAAVYWPRTDQRVLNNLSVALVRRRVMQAEFSPDILAGDTIQVGNTPLIVMTVAHVWDTEGKDQTQYSKFWLGQVVTS